MTNYEKIEEMIFKFSNLGLEISEATGAIKIGKAPHVAPLAIINAMFPVITNEEVKYIEEEIKLDIPESYRYFLTHFSNGLRILPCGISLYGLRHNYVRSIEMVWQPFNIIDYNNFESEKPQDLSHNALIIGGYDWDISKLYMTPDEKVHYCGRYDGKSLKTWDSLEEMLLEEIPRLYSLVDEKAIKKDPSQPTTPVVITPR